jgi:RNA polymerase sigma-70 factor (ECF subfamily)
MQVKTNTLSNGISSDTDEMLLEAYKASGDLELLSTLYKRYMGLVYSICLKYFKQAPASEDGVMDIFEQLIEKVKKHDIQHFKPWLGMVARNHCLMQLRKKSPDSAVRLEKSFMQSEDALHLSGEAYAPFELSDTQAHDKEALLTSMEKCLEALVSQQQTCIQLFYLEQKCYQEVAERTGFAVEKVRSYIQNGRRNLKICMEKDKQ